MKTNIESLFTNPVSVEANFITRRLEQTQNQNNQLQTKDVFSEKWAAVEEVEDNQKFYDFQYDWFLKLYGFASENEFASFLQSKKTILDTGCGLGYKAAWFAKLAPHATVIGIDISDAVDIAARNFKHIPNLFFSKGDIADTGLNNAVIDFCVCDQVIMHTEVPEKTFTHLSQITSVDGEFACYVYSKKALPREFIDDYFRKATHKIDKKEMQEFSKQLTQLGKTLSELNVSFESPAIPILGIKEGTYDIQRFIYWNFLKCFWKKEWSFDLNESVNFDWYAPSNAKRYSKQEFIDMVDKNNLKIVFFHEEEACYSGRFNK